MSRSALKYVKRGSELCQASLNQQPVTLLTSVVAFCSACRIDSGSFFMQCPRCARRDIVRLLSSFPYTADTGMPGRSTVCVSLYSTGEMVTGGETKLRDQDANTVICCPTLQHPRAGWSCDNNCALSVLTALGGLCLLYWEPARVFRLVTTRRQS